MSIEGSEPKEAPVDERAGIVSLMASVATTNAKLAEVLAGQANKQREEQKWSRLKAFALILPLAFFAALYSIPISKAIIDSKKEHIAIVRLDGEIAAGKPASAEKINAAVAAAFDSPSSRAVVLLVNSPGGSPAQAVMIREKIAAMKSRHPNKPIFTVAEDMVASAAYLVAASTDEIWVQPMTMTGSIGVIYESFALDVRQLEKFGIERRLLFAGEHKARYNPFSPLTEDDKSRLKGLLERNHQIFIDYVKQGRGAALKNDPQIFSGDWWLGETAIQLGLADKPGGIDELVKSKFPEIGVLKSYRSSTLPWFMNFFSGEAGETFGEGLVRGMAQGIESQSAPVFGE